METAGTSSYIPKYFLMARLPSDLAMPGIESYMPCEWRGYLSQNWLNGCKETGIFSDERYQLACRFLWNLANPDRPARFFCWVRASAIEKIGYHRMLVPKLGHLQGPPIVDG